MTGVRVVGDAALLAEAGTRPGAAASAAAAIAARRLPGVTDIVPGAATVLIVIEPEGLDLAGQDSLAGLAGRVRLILARPPPPDPAADLTPAEIPVCYDGPDLAEVAALTGLSAGEVIAAHQAAEYRVGWLGFSPGFGYLTGLDPALCVVPRLATPRQSVPAGSVAIAGGLSAVYPAASPGGWRLIGRTTARLWDPAREPPALFAPGMPVRFRAVDAAGLSARLPAGVPSGGQGLGGPGDGQVRQRLESQGYGPPGRRAEDPRDGSPGQRLGSPWDGPPGRRAGGPRDGPVEIVRPGPLATIQDLGRTGYAHLGVPRGGAADPASLRLANRLAGNAEGAAAIEFTFGQAVLRFSSPAVIAITGAPVPASIEAGDGAGRREVPLGSAVAVPTGSVLRLRTPSAGLRSYLAVRGGIDVPAVLGSRSSDLLSGLGPPPLRPGDRLPVGQPPVDPGPAVTPAPDTTDTLSPPPPPRRLAAPADPATPRRLAAPRDPAAPDCSPAVAGAAPTARTGADRDAVITLSVIAGPRDDWFTPAALRLLASEAYRVTPTSNRTGLRLAGPALPRARFGELPSEGMVSGALQVPPDGQPILLLADHPATGGYPVIAVVRTADIGRAAQLRPGQLVRFALRPSQICRFD